MDSIRNSMNILRETAMALSARAKAFDLESVQIKRELKAKSQQIADLEERLRLVRELVRLSTRKQAVQNELVELEDKLRASTVKVAEWEQQAVRVERDRDQWALLYEEKLAHNKELSKDMATLRAMT
ncbi:hypothetical protein DFH06DRAFT_1303759 [Mycena polygramma]|nr:hypothetical protein DFH06DRAFT_1303759 [Mycena polygramma]